MIRRSLPVLVALVMGPAACGRVGVPGVDLPGVGSRAAAEIVENRVWIDADPAAAVGSFLAFVADGTLVAGSCAAPARLGAWRWLDETTLVWQDGGTTTRAEVGFVGPGELHLVVLPAGQAPSRSFRAAQTPVSCLG